MPLDSADVAAIDRAQTVRIETAMPGGEVHRAIIWAVVDGDDVFVRSWLGERGRWYREARANPAVVILVDERRIPARAIPATDAESVRRCSDAILAKYRKSKSALSMVADEILDTTLRLDPV